MVSSTLRGEVDQAGSFEKSGYVGVEMGMKLIIREFYGESRKYGIYLVVVKMSFGLGRLRWLWLWLWLWLWSWLCCGCRLPS